MTTQTIADAFGVAKALHRGRDVHLFAKWDWRCKQVVPDRPFQALTTDDVDAGIRVLIETPANHFNKRLGVVVGAKQRCNATINRYVAALGHFVQTASDASATSSLVHLSDGQRLAAS